MLTAIRVSGLRGFHAYVSALHDRPVKLICVALTPAAWAASSLSGAAAARLEERARENEFMYTVF